MVYDLVGRVTKQTLADDRVIEYDGACPELAKGRQRQLDRVRTTRQTGAFTT